MIVGGIVCLAVGALCIVLGLLIWKKRELSLLHSYHYKNVKQEDIPAYTRQIGIGLIVIGAGIGFTGILFLAYSPYWWIPLPAGTAPGFAALFNAQKRYNGSVMS